MKNDRKLIIALIAVFVVILAGIAVFAPHVQNQNQTAYEIPLKSQDFKFFEMTTPQGSNYTLKNNHTDVGRGMYYWQNNGNFSNETDSIVICKNYTDKVIPATMDLISQNGTEKIYMSDTVYGPYYKVMKTFNDTDIVVSGYNLPLLKEMLNATKVKDTSELTLKEVAQSKAPVENKTPAVESKAPAVEEKNPVEKIIENTIEKKQEEPKPEVETTVEKEPIMIGGGSFTTGSELEDKTYARIYVGVDYAGEVLGIKILYSRDGVGLNTGNYVRATVDDSGYLNIASADSYSKYPDFAYVEVYDSSGNLKSTQGIHLNPTSGTQYF